jgi:two-component system alkaline phosphatase synthesis response regulator PhoP
MTVPLQSITINMENKLLKVLVVDDEPEILDLLNYNFTKKGLDVYLAENGKKAFEVVQETVPDVIILDIMMPEMNGIQFCELIKSIEAYKNIPILFLSATSDDLLILAAFSAGGSHYASKPIRLNILHDLVLKVYENSRKLVA